MSDGMEIDLEESLVQRVVDAAKGNKAPGSPPEPPPVVPPVTPPATPPAGEIPPVTPVAATPPAREQPPAEPVAPPVTPPVEPAIDKNKLLEEISNGTIKSPEDLNKFIEEYNKNKELTESDTYQYASKLKAWEEKGYDANLFAPIQDFVSDIDEHSELDIIKVYTKFKNPELDGDIIDLMVAEEYKQDPDTHKETEVKIGKARMQIAAKAYKEELRQLKELTTVPTASNRQAEYEQAETSRKESWKVEVPKIVGAFNEVSVSLSDDGKDTFKYALTPADKAEIQAEMDRIVARAPVKFNEEGIVALKQVMQEKFINKNINKIARALAVKLKSQANEEAIKKYNNPGGARTESVTAADKPGITQKELLKSIAETEGVY